MSKKPSRKERRKPSGVPVIRRLVERKRKFKKTADSISQALEPIAALEGVTTPQAIVVVYAGEFPGLSQNCLVELTGIDRSTLSEMIRRMVEQKGLIERKRSEKDSRANVVTLTDVGQTMYLKMRRTLMKIK